jgi:hypothetical protein
METLGNISFYQSKSGCLLLKKIKKIRKFHLSISIFVARSSNTY